MENDLKSNPKKVLINDNTFHYRNIPTGTQDKLVNNYRDISPGP